MSTVQEHKPACLAKERLVIVVGWPLYWFSEKRVFAVLV
jgi:hypothetical protein